MPEPKIMPDNEAGYTQTINKNFLNVSCRAKLTDGFVKTELKYIVDSKTLQ